MPYLTGTDSLNFTLELAGINLSLAPGVSTSFSVTFIPLVQGQFKNKSSVVIGSNDPHRKNDFTIRLYGEGL